MAVVFNRAPDGAACRMEQLLLVIDEPRNHRSRDAFLQRWHSLFDLQRHRPTRTPETPRLPRHRLGIRLPARVGGSHVDSLSLR